MHSQKERTEKEASIGLGEGALKKEKPLLAMALWLGLGKATNHGIYH